MLPVQLYVYSYTCTLYADCVDVLVLLLSLRDATATGEATRIGLTESGWPCVCFSVGAVQLAVRHARQASGRSLDCFLLGSSWVADGELQHVHSSERDAVNGMSSMRVCAIPFVPVVFIKSEDGSLTSELYFSRAEVGVEHFHSEKVQLARETMRDWWYSDGTVQYKCVCVWAQLCQQLNSLL